MLMKPQVLIHVDEQSIGQFVIWRKVMNCFVTVTHDVCSRILMNREGVIWWPTIYMNSSSLFITELLMNNKDLSSLSHSLTIMNMPCSGIFMILQNIPVHQCWWPFHDGSWRIDRIMSDPSSHLKYEIYSIWCPDNLLPSLETAGSTTVLSAIHAVTIT